MCTILGWLEPQLSPSWGPKSPCPVAVGYRSPHPPNSRRHLLKHPLAEFLLCSLLWLWFLGPLVGRFGFTPSHLSQGPYFFAIPLAPISWGAY